MKKNTVGGGNAPSPQTSVHARIPRTGERVTLQGVRVRKRGVMLRTEGDVKERLEDGGWAGSQGTQTTSKAAKQEKAGSPQGPSDRARPADIVI